MNASAPNDGWPDLSSDNLVPEFRVVSTGGARRGIRLERFFWSVLRKCAEERKVAIGSLVDQISRTYMDADNLTSAIRVSCAHWLAAANTDLTQLASLNVVNAILAACPAPAFTLSSGKRILNFNTPFHNLVRRQLPLLRPDESRHDLRLSLDLALPEIFARLDANAAAPVLTGFVLGADERRYRGQISAVRAPLREPQLLMAFVVAA